MSQQFKQLENKLDIIKWADPHICRICRVLSAKEMHQSAMQHDPHTD